MKIKLKCYPCYPSNKGLVLIYNKIGYPKFVKLTKNTQNCTTCPFTKFIIHC